MVTDDEQSESEDKQLQENKCSNATTEELYCLEQKINTYFIHLKFFYKSIC